MIKRIPVIAEPRLHGEANPLNFPYFLKIKQHFYGISESAASYGKV
jgi:hypothetical protein